MVPQRLTLITIGARRREDLRSFYLAWGWKPCRETGDSTFFDLDGVQLSIWDAELLRDEAAPNDDVPPPGWTGVTFAIHVATREELDTVFAAAVAAGATSVGPPQDRDWGGRSGYVADPEGTRWELIWAPE